MKLDFRNINTLWCSVMVETLSRLGLKIAILCPGSRCAPLTVAFAGHDLIETIPILDERSASFFALGLAKKLGAPVVLICTSGTAGANFYPAIIEAKYSRVPLIILTADRPPELRNCHAGQTIDQGKLYGNYPNWQVELALPSGEKQMLRYLRQNIIHAWELAQFPVAGAVHLNVPFREPLAPVCQPEIKQLESSFLAGELLDFPRRHYPIAQSCSLDLNYWLPQWQKYDRGIIIAGVDGSDNPAIYCQVIANLAKLLQFPVLAEALSPVRNYAHLNPQLVTVYDFLLRNPQLAGRLKAEVVILLGDLPTSKELRNWLQAIGARIYLINNHYENVDALHSNSLHLRTAVESLGIELEKTWDLRAINSRKNRDYLQNWLNLEKQVAKNINEFMGEIPDLFEGKVAWILSQTLPRETPVFIANSMSVRYAEFFWQQNDLKLQPYFSRGANGIDGTLSTALGVAYRSQSSILLTGDLALLHDSNGFLLRKNFKGHLTIILINNHGGGIFETLPISQFNPPFEEYFVTPQTVAFSKICAAYGIDYQLITTWQNLKNLVESLPTDGIRLLEVKCDRVADSLWLSNCQSATSKAAGL